MQKRTRILLLLGILSIALFLRTYHLTLYPPGLYPDEAMNGNNLLEVNRTGAYQVFYPENNGREGLFINIQGLVEKAIGIREPWVLRLPSAIFGTLTVLAVYLLAAELFGFEVALLAAFLLATSFWHIVFSRIGFRAITAPFWLAWAMYFAVVMYRKLSSGSSLLHSTFYILLSGLCLGAGFHSYIAYRVAPAIALVPMFFAWREARTGGWLKKYFTATAVYVAAAILVVAPLGWYFLTTPGSFFGRTTQVSVFSSPHPATDLLLNIGKTALMFFANGDYNWRQNYAGRPELYAPVALFLLGGLVLMVRRIWQSIRTRSADNEAQAYWLLFIMLGLSAAPVVISNEGIPHALRSILMIPPIFILAAAGGMWVFRFIKAHLPTRATYPALAGLLILLAAQGYVEYFVQWGPNPATADAFAQNYVDAGRVLNQLPDNIPKYVVVPDSSVYAGGLPMSAQTVMFLTDTYSAEQQRARNMHYIVRGHEADIPTSTTAAVFKL